MQFKGLSIPAATATVIVLLVAAPLFFVLYNSFGISVEQWSALWSKQLPGLLWNTLILAFFVAVGSFILGVSSAWLIARREFFGRKAAVWLMILPLTIPTYVFAHIYTVLLEPEGWLGRAWISLFGQEVQIPDLYNVVGVSLVLSFAGFSYIFLLVRTALLRPTRSLEEAARMQGATPRQVFFRVNLPLLRPAIAAGLAVVVLHVLSDFGAVSMLQYQTFTLSIYLQMTGRLDYQTAAGLSLILVLLSLMFLMLERAFRSRQRYYSGATQTRRDERKKATKPELLLIWGWLGLIVLFSFGLPVAWMISWTIDAIEKNLLDQAFWTYAKNSLTVASSVATLAIFAALPVALYHARKQTLYSSICLQLSSVGFVLPGPVIALGILTLVIAVLPAWYGTLLVLMIALAIRFLPLAVQSQEASLQQLTPSIVQAGRILGAGPLENLRRVILPMMRSGMVSAWVLVFIDALKELPATLLLRPTGFDTLPVRIWVEASEEMLELAAPSALMIVVGTLPIIWFMMKTASVSEKA
jgi:iron(III) transport system permease protein